MGHRNFNILFILSVGSEYGLGHLRRMQTVARAYFSENRVGQISFFCFGSNKNDEPKLGFENIMCTTYFGYENDLFVLLKNIKYDVLIFDLHKQHITNSIVEFSDKIEKNMYCIVAIDNVAVHSDFRADIRWIPSFFKDPSVLEMNNIEFGWDHYLLLKKFDFLYPPNNRRLLVLTGGSDINSLNEIWPTMIKNQISIPLDIHWVVGPYACRPILPSKAHHNYEIHNAPENLDELIVGSDYVLTVYGVSLFEALMYQRWSFAYCPPYLNNKNEVEALKVYHNPVIGVEPEQTIILMDQWLNKNIDNADRFPPELIDGKGSHLLLKSIDGRVFC